MMNALTHLNLSPPGLQAAIRLHSIKKKMYQEVTDPYERQHHEGLRYRPRPVRGHSHRIGTRVDQQGSCNGGGDSRQRHNLHGCCHGWGGVELNPLVGTSIGGLILLVGAKLGALELIENSDQTEKEKNDQKRTATAMWGGFSVSNLLFALSAATPLAIIAGLAGGTYLWSSTDPDDKKPVVSPVVALSD